MIEEPPASAPTGTPSPVIVPAQPARYAVPWSASLKFRAYVGSWFSLVIGWLIDNISTHKFVFAEWTWIAVTISSLTLIGAVVKDWMDPSVVAPINFLNKNNAREG